MERSREMTLHALRCRAHDIATVPALPGGRPGHPRRPGRGFPLFRRVANRCLAECRPHLGWPSRNLGGNTHAHPTPRLKRSLLAILALAATLAPALAVQGAAHAAATSYVALGDSYSSGVGTRSYIEDGTECQRSTLAYPSLIAPSAATRSTSARARERPSPTSSNTQLGALSAGDQLRDHLRRRQRRRLRRRADRVRDAVVGRRLRRRDRPGAGVHQQHPARRAVLAVRLDPQPGAEREGGRGRLPADLHGRGLQRRHLVLAGGGGAAQRDRRPAQHPDLRAGRERAASRSPTRPTPSSGTPSATTRSGSTGCRTRSARATTPTATGRPPATRRPSARC